MLGHVGPSAHHLIDRQRAGFGVLHLQVELPTGASSVSSIFGSTPRKANCASAQINLGEISDATRPKRSGGRMHLIILLIVFVALAAIIIWVADWTSSPRSS
jgi:hypothetical protein